VSRGRLIAGLLALSVVAAVPALAAQTGTPSSAVSADANDQLDEAVKRSQTRQRQTARPPRVGSNARRFASQSDSAALRTAVAQDPGLFADQPTRLFTPRTGEKVERYLGDFAARIDVPGSPNDVIAQSNLPLRVGPSDDKRPVDLELVDGGDTIEPRTPIVAVAFPELLAAGVDVGSGINTRLVGADSQAHAQQSGQQVFYANALADTDVFATPLPAGTETFVQLRSPDSPRQLVWQFDLPAGARLSRVDGGSGSPDQAQVVRGPDVLMRIWPPVAHDADGKDVPVSLTVDGNRLMLDVAVADDVAYPVLVDPIFENNFLNGDANPTGGVTSDILGWVREANVALGAFGFTPSSEGLAGGTCLRKNESQPGGIEPIGPVLCVTTFPTLNYGAASLGQWAWRPPSGLRRFADDFPVPTTDAYVYRADVRNSWIITTGNAVLYSGLLSGATHAYVGTSGPAPGQDPNLNGGGVRANPFVLDTPNTLSNSSFFRTYCVATTCQSDFTDPNVDGTSFNFGVRTTNSGVRASAILQGAILHISDRTPPTSQHVAAFDESAWRRSGSISSTVTGTDAGVGLQRLGIAYQGTSGPVGQEIPANPASRCQGDRLKPCLKTFAQSFTYDTQTMPEGANLVGGLAIDALGKTGNATVTVKVDRTAPAINPFTGTLADRKDRAVKDGTYELTAVAVDGANRSGVKTITFKRADNSVIQAFPMTCSGNDCPATSPPVTINVNTATLPVGVQTIKVVAEDSAGNVMPDATAATVRFVVDHAPPTITTVTHTPDLTGWFGSRTLTADATATDDASGVKRFTLTTPTSGGSSTSTDTVVSGCDDTIANLCSSPVTRSVTYATSTMGDGPARPVSLTATDALGQTSTPARQWQVNVDTAGPALTLSGPAWNARDGYIGSGSRTLQVAAVDSVDGQQRSGVARITMRVDHPPPDLPIADNVSQTCTTTPTQPCNLSGTLTVPAGLGGGEHTVYVSATDNADPANTTTTSFKFLIDEQPPTITDLQHTPALESQWRDDVPRSIEVSAHDDLSGVASFAMTLPPNPPGSMSPPVQSVSPFLVTCTGPPAAPCPSDATGTLSYATSSLDQGVRTPTVVATDRAGNSSAPTPWTLRLDRTPPTATYSGSLTQAGGGALVGGSADLRVDATDTFSGVRQIRFLVDGDERQAKQGVCDDDGCAQTLSDTFVVSASGYSTGTHTVRAEITDYVGSPAVRHLVVKEYTFTNVAGSASAPRQALGLEDFWQYDSTPTGAGSAAHVNLATGNLVWHKVPIVNRGRGLSSVVNVTYNSHDTTGLLENLPVNLRYQELGRGFSLAISGLSRLNEPISGVSAAGLPVVPNQIGLSDADGTRHKFNRIGGTTQYSHPAGVNLRLRQFTTPPLVTLPGSDTPKTWAITRPDGTTFYYDQYGYERSIEDRNGNVITFEYETYLPLTGTVVGACPLLVVLDGIVCAKRVRRVIDPGGRAIDVNYRSGTKRAGMIDNIVDHRFLPAGSRRATRFIYDANGYLTQVAEAMTQALGGTAETRITRFAYTANPGTGDQQLRQVTDPKGQATNIEYAAPNPAIQLIAGGGPPVKSITNRRAKKTTYGFGFFSDSTRAAITDPLGRSTRYTLDALSRPVEKVDARSTTTKLVWDFNNDVQELTMAAGTPDVAVTAMTYNQNGLLLTRTDPGSTPANPKVLTLTYRDGAGTQTTAVDAGGVFVSDLLTMKSPEGNTTSFGLDARGNATSRTDGENKTVYTTFDAFGQILTETDEFGNVTKYEQYDPSGMPQQVVSPRGVAGDSAANGGRWIYKYDTVGNTVSVTDPRAGALATVANPGTNFTTTITYDALDRPINTRSPKDSPSPDDDATPEPTQIVRDTTYDLNDNITKRTDAERKDTTATFTPMDQLDTVSTPSVPHGASGASSPETARYTYDDVDNVATMTTPRGVSTSTPGDFETEYRYSPVDEKIAEIRRSTNPAEPATLATSWAYDRRGNQIGAIDPRQNARYKSATPEENAQIPSRRRFTYQYDKSDNRTVQIEDPGGENDRSDWRYDRNDRMVAKIDPRGNEPGNTAADFTWLYGYDNRDLLTSVQSPAVGHTGEANAARRRTEYHRRADGKIDTITTPRGTQTTTDGTDFVTTLTYDADGGLKTRTMPRAPGQYGDPARPDVTLSYVRDAVGNPTTITDPRHHSITNTFYDSGDLKRSTRPSWWTYDEQAMTIRERTLEEIMQANSGGDSPREQTAVATSDFGDVKPEPMPDWMPKKGSTTFGYDAEMRLTRVTDVAGMASTIVRDALGRTQSTQRPFNVTGTRPAPDQPPPPPYITNAFTYDFDGNVLSEVDGELNALRHNYDQYDRLIKDTAPGANTGTEITNYTLDANGNATDVTTPRGTIYASGFDRLDRLTSSTDPEANKTTYGYDAAGNKTAQTLPRGNIAGLTAAQRDAHTTTWTYNRAGDVSTMTNGLGQTTTYGYDRDANQVRVAAPGAASAPGGSEPDQVTSRTFDGRGLPWATTTGTATNARTTVSEFDGNGNPRRDVNPKGVGSNGQPLFADAYSTSATEDHDDLTDHTDANRHATVRQYTADDLLTRIDQPWGAEDKDGTDQARKRFRMDFGLDERGRVATIDAPYEWTGNGTKAQRTKYGHYDNGWVRSVSDERIVNPADDPTSPRFVPEHEHDYSYDRRGLQKDWFSDKGRRIHREFYPNGLLNTRSARKDSSDTVPRIYAYEYTANGSLSKLTDNDRGRATSVSYDNADRALKFNETLPSSQPGDTARDTTYAYDRDSNVTSRKVNGTLVNGTLTDGRESLFTFDDIGRETVMRVKVPGVQDDRVTTTQYWPSGQVREHNESAAMGAIEKTYFNDDGRLARIIRGTKDQAYTYDDNGNRTRDERGSHVFNARDQLIKWTRAAGTPNANQTVDYELNAAGAILKKTDQAASPAVTTYEYTEDPTPGTKYVGDRLIKSVQGAQTTTYDYNGLGDITRIHPSTGADTTYTYDEFERRTRTQSGDAIESYTYDALDRRDSTTKANDTFDNSYIGLTEQLSRERPRAGGQSITYDYNSGLQRQGQVIQPTTGSATYRSYAVDANGSVEGLESSTGALLASDTYYYDPYGELQQAVNGDAGKASFRFQGFYSDSAVKTYDMQARSYRPDIGRFLSQDRFEAASADVALQSDPLTQNRYAFAGGNPVNNVEWDGHDPVGSYTNGCDNTYGSDDRCRHESKGAQRASAAAPTYAFSNNWARGRASSPKQDVRQASDWADTNIAIARIEGEVHHPAGTQSCDIGCTAGRVLRGAGNEVAHTVVGVAKLAGCAQNPVIGLLASQTCRDTVNPIKAIPAFVNGVVETVNTCTSGQAEDIGACAAIALEIFATDGAARAVRRAGSAPHPAGNGHGIAAKSAEDVPAYARSQYGRMTTGERNGALEKSPTCPYCGEAPSTQADHITSLKRDWESGGWADERATRTARVNDSDNLIGACGRCNQSKGARQIGRGPGQWWPGGWGDQWWPFGGPDDR
jgi:RHS repeat-associated protein